MGVMVLVGVGVADLVGVTVAAPVVGVTPPVGLAVGLAVGFAVA